MRASYKRIWKRARYLRDLVTAENPRCVDSQDRTVWVADSEALRRKCLRNPDYLERLRRKIGAASWYRSTRRPETIGKRWMPLRMKNYVCATMLHQHDLLEFTLDEVLDGEAKAQKSLREKILRFYLRPVPLFGSVQTHKFIEENGARDSAYAALLDLSDEEKNELQALRQKLKPLRTAIGQKISGQVRGGARMDETKQLLAHTITSLQTLLEIIKKETSKTAE